MIKSIYTNFSIILNRVKFTFERKKRVTYLEIRNSPEVCRLGAFLAEQTRLEQDPCTIRSWSDNPSCCPRVPISNCKEKRKNC